VVNEQAPFSTGYDDAGSRERGTGFLLDRPGRVAQELNLPQQPRQHGVGDAAIGGRSKAGEVPIRLLENALGVERALKPSRRGRRPSRGATPPNGRSSMAYMHHRIIDGDVAACRALQILRRAGHLAEEHRAPAARAALT